MTYCVVVGGGSNLGQFFFNFVLTFLTGTASDDFFNVIILFIQLFIFLFLLLVIFYGGYIIILFFQIFFFCFARAWAFVRVFWRHSWFVFSRCFSDEEIASFPIGSIFGFSWTNMSSQSCSFIYYSCIVDFFLKRWEKYGISVFPWRLTHHCHLPPS